VETLLGDGVDFHSINQNGSDCLSVLFLNARAHNLLYGGMCSSSRVCAGVCEGVSIVSGNETCRIDIRSIDD